MKAAQPIDINTLNGLPPDLIQKIAAYLTAVEALKLSSTNRNMRDLINSNGLWGVMIKQHFSVIDPRAHKYIDYAWYEIRKKLDYILQLTKKSKTDPAKECVTAYELSKNLDTINRRAHTPSLFKLYFKLLRSLPESDEMPWGREQPLIWAVKNNNNYLINEICTAEVSVNGVDGWARFASYGSVDTIKLVISKGQNTPQFLITLLFAAIKANKPAIVQYVIEMDKVTFKQEQIERLSLFCMNSRRDACMKALLLYSPFAQHLPELIRKCIKSKSQQQVMYILSFGICDINAKDIMGRTYLMNSLYAEQYAIADFLISNNADLNAADHEGNTALMICAKKHLTKVTQLLINKASLNMDMVNNAGQTALDIAKMNNHSNIVSVITNALSTRVTSADQRTALQSIAQQIIDVLPRKFPIEMAKRPSSRLILFSCFGTDLSHLAEESLHELRSSLNDYVQYNDQDSEETNRLIENIRLTSKDVSQHMRAAFVRLGGESQYSQELVDLNLAIEMTKIMLNQNSIKFSWSNKK
jgi:hypothetical protein